MNRLTGRRALKVPSVIGTSPVKKQSYQPFKEMIQWRKEREKKERLDRNKKLMNTLKNDINPRFQLADIRAFTLPKTLDTNLMGDWKDLGLREDLVRGLVDGLKLKKPLSSQVSGIPVLLKIKNGLFAAPTGCGKTLTYLLPLFQNLKNEESSPETGRKSGGPRAVVLVPTHELVRQVYRTAKALSHYAKLRVETIDTVFKYKDTRAADSLDLLISTPRSFLRNHLQTDSIFKIKTLALNRIIVDEADTLFSSEFATEVKQIITSLPSKDLKVLATSATITRQLQKTLTSLFPDTKIHMTAGLHAALPSLRQRFLTIQQPGNAKMKEALRIISEEPTSRIIVFCNKLVKAESLHKFLIDHLSQQDTGINAAADSNNNLVLPALFHGNLPPIQRSSIMAKFASGTIRVLICTDLAARGLDTSWVNHVINFDFPRSLQDYLHRAGRTARAGRGGAVTSFVTGKDRKLFEYIELAAKQRRILSDPL